MTLATAANLREHYTQLFAALQRSQRNERFQLEQATSLKHDLEGKLAILAQDNVAVDENSEHRVLKRELVKASNELLLSHSLCACSLSGV